MKSQQQLELQAFTVASLKTIEKEENNPYRNKNVKQLNFGLDGKIGVTNDLSFGFYD